MRNPFPAPAQIKGARRNGTKSRGPLTPQTRAKSALSEERLQEFHRDLFGKSQFESRAQETGHLAVGAWSTRATLAGPVAPGSPTSRTPNFRIEPNSPHLREAA